MRTAALGIIAIALLTAACGSPQQRSTTSGTTATAPSGMAATTSPTMASGDRIDQFAAQVEAQRRTRR